jgi:protein-disulfide isomerase
MRLFGGAALTAGVVVVAAIAISSGGSPPRPVQPGTTAARIAAQHVNRLLAGIPESGNTLGSATAPVTITEYGDLECSVCDVFATPSSFTNPEGQQGTGWEDDLIQQYVRSGKVKLVFRALETASLGNPNPNAFRLQQVAANAAGLQAKEWYYIELFYNEQRAEDSTYVTNSYLQGLARQITGLNLAQWMTDRSRGSSEAEVRADNASALAAAHALNSQPGTPMFVIQGPHGGIGLPPGLPNSYSELENAIASAQ